MKCRWKICNFVTCKLKLVVNMHTILPKMMSKNQAICLFVKYVSVLSVSTDCCLLSVLPFFLLLTVKPLSDLLGHILCVPSSKGHLNKFRLMMWAKFFELWRQVSSYFLWKRKLFFVLHFLSSFHWLWNSKSSTHLALRDGSCMELLTELPITVLFQMNR